MSKKCTVVILLLVALVLGVLFPLALGYERQRSSPLLVLCGAGMQAPMDELLAAFEGATGITVIARYDGSVTLRDYITTFEEGDLYLPGDLASLHSLEQAGLVTRAALVALHEVAILVPATRRADITGLNDLGRPGMRLAMVNPRLGSLGRLVLDNVLSRHPLGDNIRENITTYGASSLEVLHLLQQGRVDAIFDWTTSVNTPAGKGLVAIPLPEPYAIGEPLGLGLLRCSRNAEKANRLFQFIIDNGEAVFKRYGYHGKTGDSQ